MIETLIQLDHALTITINHFHAPWLDALMELISGKFTWIPLYALLLFLMYRKLGWKVLIAAAIFIALSILLSDQISVAFKNSFERLRPCHHPELSELLHLAAGCGGKFGFVSSHAANTMALAIFVSMMMRKNWVSLLMLSYAILNSYSRVYLGKHYVADVVGGMMLGALIGYGMYWGARYFIRQWINAGFET
ncbi:MAG: phosphatase PAP2 family protein [Flavobacteriales bacterium]